MLVKRIMSALLLSITICGGAFAAPAPSPAPTPATAAVDRSADAESVSYADLLARLDELNAKLDKLTGEEDPSQQPLRAIDRSFIPQRMSGRLELEISFYTGDWYYDLEGAPTDEPYDFTERRLALSFEYAFLKWLSFRLKLPYVIREMNLVTGNLLGGVVVADLYGEGIGDMEVGATSVPFRLDREYVFTEMAIDLMTKLPTGDDTISAGKLNTGTGQTDVWAGLKFKFVFPYDFSADFSAHYRWREKRMTAISSTLDNNNKFNGRDEYHLALNVSYQLIDALAVGIPVRYRHEVSFTKTSLLEAGVNLRFDYAGAYAMVTYLSPAYGHSFPASTSSELAIKLSNDPVSLGPRLTCAVGYFF